MIKKAEIKRNKRQFKGVTATFILSSNSWLSDIKPKRPLLEY